MEKSPRGNLKDHALEDGDGCRNWDTQPRQVHGGAPEGGEPSPPFYLIDIILSIPVVALWLLIGVLAGGCP